MEKQKKIKIQDLQFPGSTYLGVASALLGIANPVFFVFVFSCFFFVLFFLFSLGFLLLAFPFVEEDVGEYKQRQQSTLERQRTRPRKRQRDAQTDEHTCRFAAQTGCLLDNRQQSSFCSDGACRQCPHFEVVPTMAKIKDPQCVGRRWLECVCVCVCHVFVY